MTKNDVFEYSVFGNVYKCRFEPGRYGNGNLALRMVDAETGEPICTPTTNTYIKLNDDCIFVKDWSENEGMIDFLRGLGIIELPHAIYGGNIPCCRLTRSGMEIFEEV